MQNNSSASPTSMRFSPELATYALLSAATKNKPSNLGNVTLQGVVEKVNAEKSFIQIIPSGFEDKTKITVFLAGNSKNNIPAVGDVINLKNVDFRASVAGVSNNSVGQLTNYTNSNGVGKERINITPVLSVQVGFESQIQNLTKESSLRIEKNVNNALESLGLASLKVTPESINASLKSGKFSLEAIDSKTGGKATLNLDQKTIKALTSSELPRLNAKVENTAGIKPIYHGNSREFSL